MKKGATIILMAVEAAAMVYCILSCLHMLVSGGGESAQWVSAVMCLGAMAATIYYITNGFNKSVARAFKAMLLLCAAASILCLVPHLFDTDLLNNMTIAAAFIALGYAFCFGLYLMLAFVPDLGRKKSTLILIIILCIFVIILVFYMVTRPGRLLGNGTMEDTMRIIRMSCMCCLTVNVATCTHFKYADKKARGRKI